MADATPAGVAANIPEEIRAVMAHVQESWGNLGHAANDFDHAFHATIEEQVEDEAEHVEPTVQALIDGAHQIETELGQALTAALHALETEVTQAAHDLESEGAGLHSAQLALQAAITEFNQGCQQGVHNCLEALKHLEGTVTELHHQAEAALKDFDDAKHSFDDMLKTGFGETVHHASEHFNQTLSGEELQKVAQSFNSIFQTAQNALTEFSQHSDHLLDALQNEVQNSLENLASDVSHEVQQQIDQAFQKLIHDGLEELASSIGVAIAEAQIGAELTASMAPYLPEIIVIRHATDAIKELIAIYRELKNAIGGIGDALGGIF